MSHILNRICGNLTLKGVPSAMRYMLNQSMKKNLTLALLQGQRFLILVHDLDKDRAPLESVGNLKKKEDWQMISQKRERRNKLLFRHTQCSTSCDLISSKSISCYWKLKDMYMQIGEFKTGRNNAKLSRINAKLLLQKRALKKRTMNEND